jgi:riboflavin synthase
MFTGLVQDLGTVDSQADGRLRVRSALAADLALGDSVAVNGVCLTATEVDGDVFAADVMDETFRRTSLGAATPGARVNLELPLRPADRLGGHVVQGHVDGTGRIARVDHEGFSRVVWVAADPDLLRYVVPKGSIAVDGISLTVAALTDTAFSVSLIPETQERTTLGAAAPGEVVNLEVDVLAKYVERLVNR